MIEINLLLEKLYAHRKNLEFLIKLQQEHHCGLARKLNDQHLKCVHNIEEYEAVVKRYREERPN